MTQRLDTHRPLSGPTSPSLAAVSLFVALAAAGCDPESGADTVSPSELRSLVTTFPTYDISTDPTTGRRLNTNALGDLEFSNIDYGPGPAHDQSLKLVAIDLGDFVPHMPWEQGELWAAQPVDLTTLGLDAHMLTAQNIAGEQLRHSDFHGSRWTVRVEMEVIDEWQNQGQGVAYTLVEDNGELYGLVELVLTVGWSTLPEGADGPTSGDEDSQDAFRNSLTSTMLLIAAFATATTIGVILIGPQVMQLAFGDKFTYDRLGLAIVSVGMGFYLVAASLNQACLAQGQARRAAIPWVICAAAFVAFNLLYDGNPFRAVEFGFTGAAILLSGMLWWVYSHPHPNVEDAIEPGSGREIQARLDALDEIT